MSCGAQIGVKVMNRSMNRSLSAILAAAAIGIGTTLLLGMSPAVEAGGPNAIFGKADRMDVRPLGSACSERGWPYYEVTCLRDSNRPTGRARTVRIVSPDRISLSN
jgi:hypothetical protein